MNKNLIILRGLPGSGKSTLASIISTNVCTADDYFMIDGEYKYDVTKLYEAHKYCESECERYMKEGYYKVVVANTSIKSSHLKRYYKLAEKYGYKVFSAIVENRHGNASIHGIQDGTMERFKNNFDIKL